MRSLFTRIATWIATASGQPMTFMIALAIILIWAVTGPLFHYSDTWQLIINTGTTIVTFLMVFLIQNSQNRDGAAMQAKLDELLRAVAKARERFIGIEHLTADRARPDCPRTLRQGCGRQRRNGRRHGRPASETVLNSAANDAVSLRDGCPPEVRDRPRRSRAEAG